MTVGRGDLLLGFDAREPGPDAAWDEKRKRDFLLRLDVVRPLSIDDVVWPSAFDVHGVPLPDWVGIFKPLWETLAVLRQAVHAGLRGPVCIAAFVRVTTVCTPDEQTVLETQLRGIHPDGTRGDLPESISTPSTVEPGWTFLGYDVADLGGLSGLMNCGFLPESEDVNALRARWGPNLNPWHLFDDLADASEFKDYSNATVAEHAPFYVDGVWLVEGELSVSPPLGPPRTDPAA